LNQRALLVTIMHEPNACKKCFSIVFANKLKIISSTTSLETPHKGFAAIITIHHPLVEGT